MATRSTRLAVGLLTVAILALALLFILGTVVVFGEGESQAVNQEQVFLTEEVVGQPNCFIGTEWGKSFNHELFAIGCLNVPQGKYTLDFGDGQKADFYLIPDGSVYERLSHWYDYERSAYYRASFSVPLADGGTKVFSIDIEIDPTPPLCSIVVKDGGSEFWKKFELFCSMPAHGFIEFGDGADSEVVLRSDSFITSVNHIYMGYGVYIPKLYISWGGEVLMYYTNFVIIEPPDHVEPVLTPSKVYVPMVNS